MVGLSGAHGWNMILDPSLCLHMQGVGEDVSQAEKGKPVWSRFSVDFKIVKLAGEECGMATARSWGSREQRNA